MAQCLDVINIINYSNCYFVKDNVTIIFDYYQYY